jgi:ATP-dependent helicase/nuclease subunit A
MALYRAVLAPIWPGRRVRCALLWTDGPRLMELPEPLLDNALTKALET